MCSTVADIYRFIENEYPYYRNNNHGWRNSIRCSLSMNECFVRIPKRKDGQTKKGSYWTLHPQSLTMFDGGSFLRRRQRFREKSFHTNDACGLTSLGNHIKVNERPPDNVISRILNSAINGSLDHAMDRPLNSVINDLSQRKIVYFPILNSNCFTSAQMPFYSYHFYQLWNSFNH
ncbi:Fork head domain-containing protein FD4 [Toxocara canis]|uniref:Fork head domain-containing protein FD4 n=1 Tax=Toxocara canis TaxID=6265 RepID=A0A0B2W1J9_TOXCA|nr:Fork head domain-containing protein FD4 [Toxocara canis]